MMKKRGLLPPPPGFVSSHKSLLGSDSGVDLMEWPEIIDIAKSGKMDGRKKYERLAVDMQKHNNCAGDSAAQIVRKSIFDLTGKDCDLSPAYTYSRINNNRDNGSMLADAMVSIERHGVCLRATCGPSQIFRSQYDTQRADNEAKRFIVQECYAIREQEFGKDELQRAFWTALCLGFKVGVAIEAGSRFDIISSDGIAGVDRGGGNHAVHSFGVAYISGRLAAVSENTWGKNWGRAGRMLLTWDHFEQTIGVHSFYAARTAAEDPLNTNRPPMVRA